VAGQNFGFIWEREQAVLDGIENLVRVAAGEVGAADAACEEGVAGDEQAERGEVEAYGALGVAGSMEDLGGVTREAYEEAVGEVFIGRRGFGGVNADPAGLLGHDFELGQVALIEEDGRAG